MVNKSTDTAFKTHLSVAGYKPSAVVKGWKFDKTNYDWKTDAKPYHADPDKEPTPFTLKALNGAVVLTMPPYSATVLELAPAK
jgi:hypothetical protein